MTLAHCLLLSAALFALGAFGLVTRKNLIAVLLSVELMVNAGVINFVAFARFRGGDALAGGTFPLFVMAISACEMALALGVVMALRRHRSDTSIGEVQALNG